MSGVSLVTSLPLDSKMLPCLASHENPTQGHLGTHHTVITVEREKKEGVVGGKQKIRKALKLKTTARMHETTDR